MPLPIITYSYYPVILGKPGINRITYENGIERGRDYLPDGVLGDSLIVITSNHSDTCTELRRIILCDTSSNNITINLPTAVNNKTIYTVKKITPDTNTVTIDPLGTETIDGGLTAVLKNLDESIDFYSDNQNYKIK